MIRKMNDIQALKRLQAEWEEVAYGEEELLVKVTMISLARLPYWCKKAFAYWWIGYIQHHPLDFDLMNDLLWDILTFWRRQELDELQKILWHARMENFYHSLSPENAQAEMRYMSMEGKFLVFFFYVYRRVLAMHRA